MLNNPISQLINQHLTELLKSNPLLDSEKNIKALIMAVINKLNLVTREEFDSAQQLLLNSRLKLDQLEQQVQALTKPVSSLDAQ